MSPRFYPMIRAAVSRAQKCGWAIEGASDYPRAHVEIIVTDIVPTLTR